MDDVTSTLRQYILTHHLPDELPENLRDDTRLQSSGILDSLAMLGLVAFVEQTFALEVTALERAGDSFDRIKDIAALVAARQRERARVLERPA